MKRYTLATLLSLALALGFALGRGHHTLPQSDLRLKVTAVPHELQVGDDLTVNLTLQSTSPLPRDIIDRLRLQLRQPDGWDSGRRLQSPPHLVYAQHNGQTLQLKLPLSCFESKLDGNPFRFSTPGLHAFRLVLTTPGARPSASPGFSIEVIAEDLETVALPQKTSEQRG